MNASDFRGRHSVSGATVRVPSSVTRVGSQVEQRFIFLWDSEPEWLTLGHFLLINMAELFRRDLNCFLKVAAKAFLCFASSDFFFVFHSSFSGGRRGRGW